MNNTFKVVFNKARGALMVANEVTSCVQSKGTKTVLASALAIALIGMSSVASAITVETGTYTRGYSVVWDSAEVPSDNTINVTFDKKLKEEIVASGKGVVESYGLMIKDGATGTLENASIVSTTDFSSFPSDSPEQSQTAALGMMGGNVTLNGATTNLSATSDLVGPGNNLVTALMVLGGSLDLAADKTDISATSTNKEGKSAYGIDARGKINFLGKKVNINVTTATDRDGKGTYEWYHGQAIGIDLSSGGTISGSETTDVSINISGTGTTLSAPAHTPKEDNKYGASTLYGILAEGGQIDLKGKTDITVTGQGGIAYGIEATNYCYNSTSGATWGNAGVILGNTTIHASSNNDAYGISAVYEADKDNTVLVKTTGDLNVTAISHEKNAYALYGDKNSTITLSGNTTASAIANAENAHAYAVYLEGGAKLLLTGQENVLTGEIAVKNTSALSIDGNTVIKGDLTGDVGSAINNNGTLAIAGKLGDFKGTFTMTDGSLALTKENGYFGGTVSVEGGTLNVLNTAAADVKNTTIKTGGTLLTNGELAFGVAANATEPKDLGYKYTGVTFDDGGKLAINDTQYTLAWVTSAKDALTSSNSKATLVLTGSLAPTAEAGGNTVTSDTVIENTVMSQVQYDASKDTVKEGVQSLDKNVGVQSVSLNEEAKKADITKALTLVGSENGGELISAGGKSVEVAVGTGAALTLGNEHTANTTGSISNKVSVAGKLEVAAGSFNVEHVALSDAANVAVAGNLNVNKLSGKTSGQITIGEKNVAGNMAVDSFEVEGAKVFLDPIWKEGIEQTLDNMSMLAIKSFAENTVKSDFVVGQGSLLSLGDATTAAAQSLLTKSGVTLGNGTGKTSAALYVDASNGPLTLTQGIVVDGSLTSLNNVVVAANTLTVNNGSILLIDASKVKTSVFGENTTVTFNKGADAFVDNITKDGLLLAGTGSTITLNDVVIRTNDKMIALGNVTDGLLEATVVSDKDQAGITDQGVFEAIKGVYDAGRNNTNATHQADAFAARVAQGEEYFGSMEAANQVATEVRALATMAGVQSTSWDSASLFNDRIQARQSLANLSAKGTGLWADLYASRNKSEGFGSGAGYEADIYGGIFGADTTLQNGLTLGAALTYAKADTDTTGTLAKINNKSDFVGVSAYGAMPLESANVMADVTYLYGDHDVKANAGGTWGDTVKTNLFAVGVRAEWLSTYAGVNVMPHVGLRFTTLETDGYEAAFDTEKTRQNIVTLPVGVTLSADLTAGDWTLKPIADFSVIPAIGDRDIEVAYGASQKLSVNVIDGGLFNATLGLAAQRGDWSFGVNYRLGVGGNNRSNNTLNANMSYAF